jgi:hypothetical protein
MNKEPFANLDFGTKPTASALEVIDVAIDPKLMLDDFAHAYVMELTRRNPGRAGAVSITEDELQDYFESIIALRVQCVHGTCKVWREIKQLMIPTWIEFTISMIGEVVDTDRGLRFVPQYARDINIEALLSTSDKLRFFVADGVSMSKDAFPRGIEGDVEVMSMAIINDYVQSQSKDSHPIASYVAAFLGFKLQEETAFKMLYRVRYDDVKFIRAMLLREGAIY